MLNLKDREWQTFYIKDIFTEIQRGKRLKTADHHKGKIPYISSSAINNGVANYISNEKGVRKFSNCLTVANSGSVGKTFYHRYIFVASDHVTQLKNPELNQYVYRFLAPLVSRIEKKYSFNREINDARINKEKILLPVDATGEPDWQFMADYIREREQTLIECYIAHADKIGKNEKIERRGIASLAEKKWKEFPIEAIADIESGRDIYEDERMPGLTPYVGASSLNNGICHFISNDNTTKEGGCLSVNRNGSVGYAFFHPYNTLFSNDCRKLRLKRNSRYAGLFIAHQITKQRHKYSYGYKMGTGRLKRQLILLPTTANGEPDWEYMEQYAKKIMHHQLTTYLEYMRTRRVVCGVKLR